MIKVNVTYSDDKEDKIIEVEEDLAKAIIALDGVDGAVSETSPWLWEQMMDELSNLKEEIGLEHDDLINILEEDNG